MRPSSKLLVPYFVSTCIFLIGHYLYLGWDFSVYVLNAQYLFDSGHFFEIGRAPFVSFLIGMFGVFGWTLAEYLYIVFASLLFLYSSVKLAQTLKLPTVAFYLFSLNSFVLLYGLLEGSELLSLALLELFLALIIEDGWYAGFFLGLACLTRYPLIVFFPLLLFHKGWKKLFSALIFVIPFIPWFLYNKLQYGNIFYSIADSYAVNILYREYVPHTINYANILLAANILVPLIAIGAFYFMHRKKILREKIILLCATLLILYSIYTIKADVARYYLPLTIPFVVLAVSSLQLFSKRWNSIILVSFIVATLLMVSYALAQPAYRSGDFTPLVTELDAIEGCALQSNIWVHLNYYGRSTEPVMSERAVGHAIEEGYYVLIYYDAREPPYMHNRSFLEQYPIVSEDSSSILLGEGCLPVEPVDASYLEKLNAELMIIDNYMVSEDPCEILFHGNRMCAVVNDIFTVS